ncbi:outer membrane beta-barrel protein [Pedobacter gandavensis]|uniref:outer membrane beta-barrel protein n=1 Tax=Pedobacter gandavensis TaxID=2679963 RepID=UPI0029305CAB|nr:outer membrane beta-barrel protein [Pedobacter gandavensis]
MKAIITGCLSLLFVIPAKSQSNFYKVSAGGGFGLTQSFTDVKKSNFGLAGYGVIDYYFSPFISAGIEGQMGEINGSDAKKDPNARQFINAYTAINLNTKFGLGALIDYNPGSFASKIKGLYLGAGLGVVMNSVSNVRKSTPTQVTRYPGKDQSNDILVPINLGINFYFTERSGYTRYILNFNYQSNFTLGEGLDGYDNSTVNFKSGNPDIYTYFSAGIRYQFGSMGLHNKTIF